MFEFIERLRAKPESHKKKIAVAGSALVTAAIFFVWLSVFRLGTASTSQQAAVSKATSTSSPFAELEKGYDDAMEILKKRF